MLHLALPTLIFNSLSQRSFGDIINPVYIVAYAGGSLATLALVLMSAVPMVSIYPILAQKYGQDGPAATALLGTTVASFFTLTAFLWVLQHGW